MKTKKCKTIKSIENSEDNQREKAEEWSWRRPKMVERSEGDKGWKRRKLQIKNNEDGKG